MKIYRTHQRDEGLAYPSSGQVLGWLADGLGLKTWLRQEVEEQDLASSKTLQRYFKGSFLKDRDTIDAIVSLFIEQLFIGTQGVFGVTTAAWDAILKNVLADWDLLASALNEVSFPLSTRGDQLLVAMRLLLPEIASRASIALCFGQLSLGVGAERITYIDERWFSKTIIGYFIEWFKPEDETHEAFAERCGTSPQTVHGWRVGSHLPTSDNIETLAKAFLADRVSDEEYTDELAGMTVRVRFHRAIAWFFGQLESLIGEDFSEMLADALHRMTAASYMSLIWLMGENGEEQFVLDVSDLLVEGTRSDNYPTWVKLVTASLETSHVAFESFQPKTLSDGLQRDLLAWAGGHPLRFERLQYWTAKIGGAREEISVAQATPDLLAKQMNDMLPMVKGLEGFAEEFVRFFANKPDLILLPYYRLLERPIEPGAAVFSIPTPLQLGGAIQQARSLCAQGDLPGAIEVLRAGIHAMPDEPYHHFLLGSMISDAIVVDIQRGQGLDMSLYAEGKKAIERAIHLAPDDAIFANELGVFLARAGMSEAAEEAFADAEKVSGEHSLYWFGRGVNLLRLGEHQRGQRYIEESLDYARGNTHAQAYVFLSMLHVAYGNKQKGERYGTRAEQLGQPNPCSWGREQCIAWLMRQAMWPPKDGTAPL